MKRIWITVVVLLLVGLACQAVIPSDDPSGGQPSSGQPSSGGQPSAGKPAGGQPSGGQPSSGGGAEGPAVLFEDDFSGQKGWDIVDLDYKSTTYQDGGFRIWVNKAQLDVWSTLNQDLGQDVVIEVDATKTFGPDVNDYGVVCRFAEVPNDSGGKTYYFYYFLVSSDGKAVIAKVDNSQQTYFSQSGQMEPASAVKPGMGTNHIRAECIGNQLTLYVNGQKVASATDSGLASKGGDVALIAGTFDEIGVVVWFDNLKVLKP